MQGSVKKKNGILYKVNKVSSGGLAQFITMTELEKKVLCHLVHTGPLLKINKGRRYLEHTQTNNNNIRKVFTFFVN